MRLALLLGLTAAVLALPSGAVAGILAPEDATEAASALAEAQAEQDVCYGWAISNDFDGTPDIGSSTGGPYVPLDLSVCERFVILNGHIHYACSTCEDSDSGDVSIETNLAPAPSEDDLSDLGLNAGDLTGDRDDVTLLNMIGALPLLAAQTGAAPPLPAGTPESVPAGDTPTDKPGSDLMRESWLKLLFFVFLLGAGPLLWLYLRQQDRAQQRRQQRKQPPKQPRPAQSSPPPPPNPTEA